jgi:ankyrin repeat protein
LIFYFKGGWTALLRCAENGHVEAIRMLLDAGSNIEAAENVSQMFCFLSILMSFNAFDRSIVAV